MRPFDILRLRTPPAVGGGGTPLGTARYWRVFVDSNNGGGGLIQANDVEFRGSVGGSDLVPVQTGDTASILASSAGAGNNKYYAFNDSTDLLNSWAATTNTNAYIGYDFGSAVSVYEVAIRMQQPAVTNQRAMANTRVQMSNDNITYTDVATYNFGTTAGAQGSEWLSGIYRTIPDNNPPGSGFHRLWRVYIPTVNAGGLTVCAEIQWRAIAGGADQSPVCSTNDMDALGRVIYSTQNGGNEAWRAYDGTTASGGWAGNAAPQWLGFVFPVPVKVLEIAYTCWSAASQWTPTAIDIQYSDDGGATWTTQRSHTGLTFTNSETKILAAI